MPQAVIIDAVRTPLGRSHPEKGIYRDVRADDLLADIMKAPLAIPRGGSDQFNKAHWGERGKSHS